MQPQYDRQHNIARPQYHDNMFDIIRKQMISFYGANPKPKGQSRIDETKKDPFPVEDLPSDLKQRLAAYLSTRELLNLAEASKKLYSDLSLSMASSPLTDRVSQDKNYRSIRSPQCFAVVIPRKEYHIHSMIFTCNVTEYGVAQARVSIVEHNLPTSLLMAGRFFHRKRGKEVARDDVTKATLSLSFLIKPGRFYQLYIRTNDWDEGLGDDSFVQFSDMKLHRVGFGNNDLNTECTTYQFDVFQHQTQPLSFPVARHSVGSSK